MTSPSASLNILGVPVTPFDSLHAAVDCVRDRIARGQKTLCVAINPEKIQRAHSQPALRRVLESADVKLCDGVGVLLAALLLYRRKVARCTGVDLFIEILRLASAEHWKVYLLGGTAESNAGARRRLVQWLPGIEIAGCRDGYFGDSAEVVDEINSSGAQILFVGLGSPRQEFWLAEHAGRLRPALCMGVGGSFDVLSNHARRAPLVFRRTGCEWLFRLIMQPQRMRRQLALPIFAMRVLKERLVSRHAT